MGPRERDKAPSRFLLHIFAAVASHPFHQKSSTLVEGGVVAEVSSQGPEQDGQGRKTDLGGHTENNQHSAVPIFFFFF